MSEKKPEPPKRLVFIVDPHPIVRDSLRTLLEKSAGFAVCGEAGTAADALQRIESGRAGLVVSEIALGKGRDGLELIKDLAVRVPSAALLVFSGCEEAIYTERALRAGARGYLSKTEPAARVIEALERIASGDLYVSSRMSARLVAQFIQGDPGQSSAIDRLTDRELEIFQLIGRGHASRQIAAELKLDPKTVETYRGRIKAKLQLINATDLHQQALHWVESGALRAR